MPASSRTSFGNGLLPDLRKQQSSTFGAVILKRGTPAGGKACHGPEKFLQHACTALIKAAVGATAERGHLPENLPCQRLATLLEQEQRQLAQATLACQVAQ